MGRDIHVKILQRKDDKTYCEIAPYIYNIETNSLQNVSDRMAYCDRNYDLFDALNNSEKPFSCRGIFEEAPKDVVDYFSQDYLYGVTYFDWCELVMFAQTPLATVFEDIGYEYIDKDPKDYPRRNVVQPWVDSIRVVLDMYEVYWPHPGEIIIQIAFDCQEGLKCRPQTLCQRQ